MTERARHEAMTSCMSCFATVGSDLRLLPLDQLAALAAAGGDPLAAAARARERIGARGAIALVTCNRVELALATVQRPDAETLAAAYAAAFPAPLDPRALRAAAGEAALRHLLRVACALESAALGEEQILGQVREALQRARDAAALDATLCSAFDLALQVGKKVRRETDLAQLGCDLARLALRHLRAELHAPPDAAPLALIGTGAMAEALLTARPKQARNGWLLVGRDAPRCAALAARHGTAWQQRDDFLAARTPLRGLIGATSCERPLFAAEWLAERLPLCAGVVDLGLPRNVDPAARDRFHCADLDDLRARAADHAAQLAGVVPAVEAWIEAAIARRGHLFVERRDDGAALAAPCNAPAPFAMRGALR